MLLTVESDVQVLGDNMNDSTADRIKWCVIGDIRLHSGLSSAWVGLRGAAGFLCLAWICLYQTHRSELLKLTNMFLGLKVILEGRKIWAKMSENLQKGKGNEQSFTPSTTVCIFDSSLSRSRWSVGTLRSSRVNRKRSAWYLDGRHK